LWRIASLFIGNWEKTLLQFEDIGGKPVKKSTKFLFKVKIEENPQTQYLNNWLDIVYTLKEFVCLFVLVIYFVFYLFCTVKSLELCIPWWCSW